MEELVFLLGWVFIAGWYVTPAIRIWRTSPHSNSKKMYWAIGTFVPSIVAVGMSKLFQFLALTQHWAQIVFDHQASAFLVVMLMFVGNWIVLGIHDKLFVKSN